MALPLVVKIAPVVDLTAFNVTSDSYETFVQKVRDALAGNEKVGPDKQPPEKEIKRSVLRDKETTADTQPLRWIHVQLYGKRNSKPTVAIRSDNVYIMGFTNSAGRWYQLNKNTNKIKLVADNPVMAGFDGNYNDLVGGADKLTGLNLNKFSVAEAAAKLWEHKANLYGDDADGNGNEDEETATLRDDNDIKKAVATLAVAICEAARFIGVSDVIEKGWSNDKGVKITPKEVGYIKNWEDLSSALLLWKKKVYTDDENIFKDLRKKAGISNGKEALGVVALVKLLNVKQNTMAGPTDEQLLAYAELPKLGRYMAEVFAVRVPAAAGGGHPPRGTISFHGGHYCSDFIYSLSPQEAEHTSSQLTCDSQGNILLTGPSMATSAYSPIVFNLDLHDGFSSSSKSQAGRIVCDVAGGDFYSYDRAITETVETGYGPAEVTYAVLTNGVQGLVAVKLASLQVGDEEGAGILGWIVARSKLFDDVGSVLFYNDDARKIVRGPPGGELLLPLARQALAVPLHMPLTIELDLRSSSSGDEIARGAIEFNPAIEGQHSQRLVGVNGSELEVTISWSEYPW